MYTTCIFSVCGLEFLVSWTNFFWGKLFYYIKFWKTISKIILRCWLWCFALQITEFHWTSALSKRCAIQKWNNAHYWGCLAIQGKYRLSSKIRITAFKMMRFVECMRPYICQQLRKPGLEHRMPCQALPFWMEPYS